MKQKIEEVKEVVNNLEGRRIMKCPHCKHTQFIRKGFDLVEVYYDEEEGGYVDEEIIPVYEEYVFVCRNCNEEVEAFFKEEEIFG